MLPPPVDCPGRRAERSCAACIQLAASDAQCRAYANQAVDQQAANIDCGHRLKGDRWNLDRDAHYRWCRAMPLEAANRETRLRAAELRACEGKRSACLDYANNAVSHNRSMHINRCGYSGTRWSSNFGDHRYWCMNVSREDARREHGARIRMLHECRSARRR